MKNCRTGMAWLIALSVGGTVPSTLAQQSEADRVDADRQTAKPKIDRSGQPRRGIASYYADRFSGRTMADGTKMDPEADIAASRTLPLGTRAEVINLENGKRVEVEIRDRGPYVEGRIVDVSPKVARDLGIVEQGLAEVEVRPLALPGESGAAVMVGSSADERTESGR